MAEARVERRLSAILAADIAGYSRLMGADEVGTLAALKAHRREIVDPAIAAHKGRIVKTTGDGMLVEFASAVDALTCAVAIQKKMADQTAEGPRIQFRVGINIGDIIVDGGDIYGDGVNIAARLEAMSEPGGICVSGLVRDSVLDKLAIFFEDMGEQPLKNIARPVRVYRVKSAAEKKTAAAAQPALIAGAPLIPLPSSRRSWRAAIISMFVLAIGVGGWLSLKPKTVSTDGATDRRFSMIVLPFVNLSGDPTQEYLADAITEGLTSDLSRIKGGFVIARSTAFTYKSKPVDVKQVGVELGVRYALEGSAQIGSGKVRVNAQLIDAESGAHLWADQFDADRSDLLDMQDQIVTRLTRALSIELVDAEVNRVKRTRPGNLDAEDFAMRCLSQLIRSTDFEDVATIISPCQRALQIDDKNVLALSWTAIMTIFPVTISQSGDPATATKLADELASKALAIDPNYSVAHSAKALVLMAEGRHEEAIVEAERSVALNPSDIYGYLMNGVAHNFLCEPDQSIDVVDKAIRLSPRDPLLWALYEVKGEAFFIKQQNDKAISWFRKELTISARQGPYGRLLLVSALALDGRLPEAHDALKIYLASSFAKSKTISEFRAQQLALASSPKWLAYNDRIFDGLRKAGMPEQ